MKENGEVSALPEQKRGRHLLLGKQLDAKVQAYLRKLREGGGVVSARIAMAAARGLLNSCDRGSLVEYGGHIDITRSWAYSLLQRMGFVKRKCTTSKSKHTSADFEEMKKSFLADVVSMVKMENIPPELILNWDQTGLKIVPSSGWTMEKEGSQRVEIIGVGDKRQITAVYCASLVGDFLPIQLIYGGKTNRCHPKFKFPLDWDITHSEKHWSNEITMIQYIKNIIIPYTKRTRELIQQDNSPALVIMDNFKGQITTPVFDLLDENNIHVCLLPANTTDQLQPLDISVNKPAKDFLKRKFEDWYSEKISNQLCGHSTEELESIELNPVRLSLPLMKELVASWLVEMFEYIQNNPQIAVNGFLRAGICDALDGKASRVVDADELVESSSESEYSAVFSDFEYSDESEYID